VRRGQLSKSSWLFNAHAYTRGIENTACIELIQQIGEKGTTTEKGYINRVPRDLWSVSSSSC
jgi:hypothetical protein